MMLLALALGLTTRPALHHNTLPKHNTLLQQRITTPPTLAHHATPPSANTFGSIGYPEPGPAALVGERDACGVGFIADSTGARTHKIMERALRALSCMEHRGGCGGDRDSGDGAGVLTAVPWELFESEGALAGKPATSCGVAQAFLPQDAAGVAEAEAIVATNAERYGFEILTWRDVPQAKQTLGPLALDALPTLKQAFFYHPDKTGDELEEALYRLRRSSQADLRASASQSVRETYFASCSSKTIVYKGMVRSEILGAFFGDLTNPAFQTNYAIYHRRFSTNTVPKWPLAQPMRHLAHNGEINTLIGNVNWQRALDISRERRDPLTSLDRSDSANLDSVFENACVGEARKTAAEALSVLVPEAYRDQPEYDAHPAITDMFEYYAGLQEPWDGPALLTFCDGKQLGATLDRNGLRPARYLITKDGLIAFMSETGVVDVDDADVIAKGRLGPGNMVVLDLETGKFSTNLEVKNELASKAPFGEWLAKNRDVVAPQPFAAESGADKPADIVRQMTAFGWSSEDLEMQVADMYKGGKETLFSMGDDTALAVLSSQSRTLYDYFKQRFAQVTNPPIDPLREGVVMGLDMTLGKRHDYLGEPKEEFASQLRIKTPVLNQGEMDFVASKRSTETISTLYPVSDGPSGLAKALDAVRAAAEKAVAAGAEVVVLSDKSAAGLGDSDIFIPPLLAVGAVHHHLIKQGLRLKASIVVETAQAWSTHHIAMLVGYGASAVHPYLLWGAVRHLYDDPKAVAQRESNAVADISLEQAYTNTRKALEAGVLKILSKIGISLLSSYHGAQIFEAIGLGKEVIDAAFAGTPSRVGGLSLSDLAEETVGWHAAAFGADGPPARLNNYGFVKYYQKKEHHDNTPPLSKKLHKALQQEDSSEGYSQYRLFEEAISTSPAVTLRDMMQIESDRKPVAIEEVESVEDIMRRFCTGGMSLGALSREAHETLALGVNRAGGRSNSGEGGEDEARWEPISDADETGHSPSFPHLRGVQNGDVAISKVKQVASGRFGVTPAYLMSAEQIEIKVAQGAKPGEGGQLPASKVNPYIASIRACKTGVMLISPPPHHDIYSIEDLAQLIYDLHMINPKAKVSVKLVGQVGIGTVASGVAKADADVIQISGHDGGTGASPLTSIKHAGGPWELGLAEAQKALIENNLRDRVVLRVDGGLKTGHDVVLGALLGADEFGFGTIAMIAVGCVMARICHTNNCPVGVTTQKEKLREKFTGVPSDMFNFFLYVAQEVREVLAHLGYTKLSDVVGRADLLTPRDRPLAKTSGLDLSFVTQMPDVRTERAWEPELEAPHAQTDTIDDELLARADVASAIADHKTVAVSVPICNTDRTAGARIAGAVAQAHGNRGWKGGLHLTFNGCAGQSFGFSCLDGLDLEVVGDANDYVGKSMHGGRIRIRPQDGPIGFDPSTSVIIGNTCLYGATGGKFYASGRAGERFCVRNSNARAVVEGTGDHCCEYMTGGVVAVLGPVGRNVGAGMTGGWGYFLEEGDGYDFAPRINSDVNMQRVNPIGAAELKRLLEEHKEATGSVKAAAILADWDNYLPKFWQVYPISESEAPEVSGIEVGAAAGAEAVLA